MRPVRVTVREYQAAHNRSDPRGMLDSMYWSAPLGKLVWGSGKPYQECDKWCDEMLGPDDWYRMFNKYWFTSREHWMQWKLAWGGDD